VLVERLPLAMTAVRADGTIDCFRQFIAREDGDFGAYHAMASERNFQTDYIHAKSLLLPLSHAWCVGVLLYACEAALETPELA
jgi:hypothetical protein